MMDLWKLNYRDN